MIDKLTHLGKGLFHMKKNLEWKIFVQNIIRSVKANLPIDHEKPPRQLIHAFGKVVDERIAAFPSHQHEKAFKQGSDWEVHGDFEIGGKSEAFVETLRDGTGVRFCGDLREHSAFPQDYERIVLRVRGDGQPFLFHVKTKSFMLDSDMFQIAFKTKPDGTWCNVKAPFSRFKLIYKGHVTDDQPEVYLKNVLGMGITVAGRKPGPFQLDIASIHVEKDS
ncbi:Complex I intermediate-associated protein 30, mitochondrial [Galdieria sulphuraria]|nr:Complex I intermediate-associated protein 30, mitochondrial [Galdieria sulphuraria]